MHPLQPLVVTLMRDIYSNVLPAWNARITPSHPLAALPEDVSM